MVRGALLALALAGVVGVWSPRPVSGQAVAPDTPLVLAFYYNWFDENTWSSGQAADVPTTLYNSRDRAAIERHVAQAQSAGIDAFAVGWYGPQTENNQTETNLALMLEVADGAGFRVTVEYGPDSPFVHSQGDVVDALRHAITVHAQHPSWLRHEEKPVIVFWALSAVPAAPGQSPLDAWRAIRDQVDPDHETVWIAEGTDVDYLDVFDGHHLYSIAWSPDVGQTLDDWGYRVRRYNSQRDTHKLWVATVMPGYDDTRLDRPDAFARDREGGAFYRQCWQAAEASQPDWIIITSWNEWLEGSHIEPSQQYGELYLDLTRELVASFKGHSPAPLPAAAAPSPTPVDPSAPTPTAVPSPTPLPPPPEPAPGQTTYTVRTGDTLSQIAERFGVSMAALMEANGITDPDHIRIGQVLVVPRPAQTPEPAPQSAPGPEPTPRSEPSPEPLTAPTEFVPPTVGPTVVVPPTVGPTEVSGTGVTPPPTASPTPSPTATPGPHLTPIATPTATPAAGPLTSLAPRLSGVLLCIGLGALAGAALLLGVLVWLWARGKSEV